MNRISRFMPSRYRRPANPIHSASTIIFNQDGREGRPTQLGRPYGIHEISDIVTRVRGKRPTAIIISGNVARVTL